jgi:hypothetical protein
LIRGFTKGRPPKGRLFFPAARENTGKIPPETPNVPGKALIINAVRGFFLRLWQGTSFPCQRVQQGTRQIGGMCDAISSLSHLQIAEIVGDMGLGVPLGKLTMFLAAMRLNELD